MPIHDYLCADCGHTFEELVRRDERPGCPVCQGERVEKEFSPQAPSAPSAPAEPVEPVEPVAEQPEPEAAPAKEAPASVSTPAPAPVPEKSAAENAGQLEQKWRERQPTSDLERDDRTLRRDDPELWDLERTFERRQATQLAEIADKSQRLVKLMDRIEQLEPLTDEVALRDRELAALRDTVHALEEAEHDLSSELEQRTHALDDVTQEVHGLRSKVQQAGHDARDHEVAIEALMHESTAEKATLAKRLDERDHKLAEARAQLTTIEGQLKEHERRVEDSLFERDNARAELESRTAALFKRDELIQEADEKADELREEIRERDRRVADAHQQSAELQNQMDASEAEVRRRDVVVHELEQRVDRLDVQLAAVKAELAQAGEALTASTHENQELTDAWASATSEMELHRARFLESASHLQITQSVLAELKPMLESLETTLSTDEEEAAAALPSETSPARETSND